MAKDRAEEARAEEARRADEARQARSAEGKENRREGNARGGIEGSDGSDNDRWECFVNLFGSKQGGRIGMHNVPWPREAFHPPSTEHQAADSFFKNLLLRWHPDKFNVFNVNSIDEAVTLHVPNARACHAPPTRPPCPSKPQVLLEVTEVAKRIIRAWGDRKAAFKGTKRSC